MKYSLREIPSAKPKEFPEGSGYISLYFLTRVTLQTFSIKFGIVLPGRSVLQELILRIALTAGQYRKILPSKLSNTKELNFIIIMLSN